jgi:peptidoglycan/xylan/chitin deacetylase (PgdA/CDA1 family)
MFLIHFRNILPERIKALIRKSWGLVFFYGGVFHLIRFLNNLIGKRITIVTYHRVTDRSIEAIEESLPFLFASVETFRRQILFLEKWYRIISFEKLSIYIKDGKVPWNSLIITFDDGYEDNYLMAYPVLRDMNAKATFFLAVDKIAGNGQPWWWDRAYCYFRILEKVGNDDRLFQGLGEEILFILSEFKKDPSRLFGSLNKQDTGRIVGWLDTIENKYPINNVSIMKYNGALNWQQISDMNEIVDVGSHSCSHSNITMLDQSQRNYEIGESRKLLQEKTKRKVIAFSYPGGSLDENAKRMVRDSGYEFAVTTAAGVNDLGSRYGLKRINLWEGASLGMHGLFSKGYLAYKLLGF